MWHNAISILAVVAALGAISSIAYYGVGMGSAVRFLRQRNATDAQATHARFPSAKPAVSILKPLKGTDPQMYANFRSHCLQDYPEFEIIFGVSEPTDPAITIVERLQAEFPQLSIGLVICRENIGANTKVSNLAQMLTRARHQYLVVNDSDIRVEPDYLQRVVAPLTNPQIGLVTCLYRGAPSPGLGACLESLSISTDFCAGVLAARLLEGGIRFGLGSTLAVRRSDVAAIGGFEALADYLADDYELGRRIAALGLEVTLSEAVVETFLPPYPLRGFINHQLRWARTIRDSRRWGYAGLVLTFGIPWALLALFSAQGAGWAWELLGLTLAARLAAALLIARGVLGDRQIVPLLWLVPVRDLIAVLVWAGGFGGHTVLWRGRQFRLKDGKLARMGS